MKKYTVYEIEKLTDGQLSKYKLTKAIEQGELKAEKVESDKKGRGVPKYFIYEEELNLYLDKIRKQRKNKIVLHEDGAIPKVRETNRQSLSDNSHVVIDQQSQEIQRLQDRIKFLETAHAEVVPELESEKKNAGKRRGLLMELAHLSVFSGKRRKEILQDLTKL